MSAPRTHNSLEAKQQLDREKEFSTFQPHPARK